MIPIFGSFVHCLTKTAYRLFAFWDKDSETLVVATHGFMKKLKKHPQKEIAKAKALRKEYFKNK